MKNFIVWTITLLGVVLFGISFFKEGKIKSSTTATEPQTQYRLIVNTGLGYLGIILLAIGFLGFALKD